MVLISDLKDGVAYTSSLNGLKGGRFKFSLVEQEETTLVEALRNAADFIHATEICADNSDAPKKVRIPGVKNLNRSDRNPEPSDRRPQFRIIDLRFTTDARRIFMELGDIPCSKDRHQ